MWWCGLECMCCVVSSKSMFLQVYSVGWAGAGAAIVGDEHVTKSRIVGNAGFLAFGERIIA